MQRTIIGSIGRGVEYAGRMPGTKVGSFGPSSSGTLPLLVPRPTVEKEGRIERRRFDLCQGCEGDWLGESSVAVVNEVSNTSAGFGRAGRAMLVGGVAVPDDMAPELADSKRK